ncbi:MAG: DegT/DnrJ/EryC1/StrS family aminotransferase [Verrucomicrobiota bacterium]
MLNEVIDSGVLSAFIGAQGKLFLGGQKVRQFESRWSEKFNQEFSISVNSWTSGLIACIGAADVGPGDEVIVSPYTMSASAVCPLFYGAVPVFADIDEETFNLNPVSVEEKITERTKAIVVVHLFGHPAPMNEITAIGKKHNIAVIEDAAQAPGATYGGKPVGAIGDMGGFSFNFHKHIHTGEGGMIVTNNEKLAQKCQRIRNHGENASQDLSEDELINSFGSNLRMTELQAAIGTVQLDKLDELLETRNQLADYLAEKLSKIPGLTPQLVKPDCTHARYVFSLKFNAAEFGCSRTAFARAVAAELPDPGTAEEVVFAEGYINPLYRLPIFQKRAGMGVKHAPLAELSEDFYADGQCPVAERMFEQEMLISPLIREPLTTTDMDDIVLAIQKCAERVSELEDWGDSGEKVTLVDHASR